MVEKSAPRLMRFTDAEFSPRFEYGDQAQVAALCGAENGTRLGAGLVRLTGASIPWTIKYDELIHVLEGAFTVETAGGTLTARARDSIWLPAGTRLTYQSEQALLFYAIYPADWAAG
jgi:ethanolamine utilization protein EutQ